MEISILSLNITRRHISRMISTIYASSSPDLRINRKPGKRQNCWQAITNIRSRIKICLPRDVRLEKIRNQEIINPDDERESACSSFRLFLRDTPETSGYMPGELHQLSGIR
jgi:hypothetical protein